MSLSDEDPFSEMSLSLEEEDPFPVRELPRPFRMAPPQDSIGARACHYLTIESIEVKDIVGTREASIYGSVLVDACHFVDYAFNRESNNPEIRRVGDQLTLTGPNVKLLGCVYTKITVDLYDGDRHRRRQKREKSPFASGVLAFMLASINFNVDDVNRRLSYDFSGKWGTVTLNYAILDRAITTKLKITIIGTDENGEREEEDLEVFGTIGLSQIVRETETIFRLKLFDHPTVEDRVKVTSHGILPLERHVVATPTAPDLPQLIFHVDLWAKGCHDDQVFPIAMGDAQFNVKPLDKVRVPKEKIIFGNCGRNVRVSFTFLS